MVGLAIYEGVEELHVYGADCLQQEEYWRQRPCIESRIEKARQSMKVYIPNNSALFSGKLYGYF